MHLNIKYGFMIVLLFLTGCDKMQIVNFKSMELADKPNFYLVCPENYCSVAPGEISPSYPMNITQLKTAWDTMIAAQPRVKLVDSIPTKQHYQYVQRSLIFRFPDYIDVEFISLSDKRSTLAIYSRAKYGYYDFDVNKKRIKSWLEILPNYFS